MQASAEYHLSVIDRRKTATKIKIPEADVKGDQFSEQMRTAGKNAVNFIAAVMLAQLYKEQQKKELTDTPRSSTPSRSRTSSNNPFEDIRSRVIKEMMALEQQRLEMLLSTMGDAAGVEDLFSPGPPGKVEDQKSVINVDQDDPSGIKE